MQTEAQGDMTTSPVPSRKQRGLRGGLTILLILLLFTGAFVLLFRHQANSTTHNLPATIHWQQVLQQYFVESLVAAPGDPARLYACALPSPPELNMNSLPSPTDFSQIQPLSGALLRSTDSGAHWQTLKASLRDNFACSIAVNTVNVGDLYVASASFGSTILKHSSDGGQTWTTIQATLTMPDGQNVAWAGSRLSFVGNHLFAVQNLQNTFHVITSVDGGRLWTVIDTKVVNAHQAVRSYAVDPTTPRIIYELVGAMVVGKFSYVALGATPSPLPSPVSAAQLVGQLYKTTNGGASWQEMLSAVPYGSSLQLASAHPDLLYVGGVTGNISATSPGTFYMQRSVDGGTTWQQILAPSNVPLLNNWFIDASGLLYDTARPETPHSGNNNAPTGSIQRYDPSANQWSTLAVPSTVSFLLAVTSMVSTGGNVLWSTNLGIALYRGTL